MPYLEENLFSSQAARDGMRRASFLLLGIVVTLACRRGYSKWRSNRQYGRTDLPRLQKRWYLFGIDTLIQDFNDLRNHNSSNRSAQRHRELGATYNSTILGQSTIHTVDPANIVAVTTHSFSDFSKGAWTGVIARYMGKGILVNDGHEWQASRTLLKPLFRRSKAADMKMFAPHVDRLLDYLWARRGDIVDFRRCTQMVVLDIVTDMLYGESSMSLEEKPRRTQPGEEKGLLDLIDELEPYGSLVIEMGPFAFPIFAWRYGRIMQLVRGIQSFFHRSINDAWEQRREKVLLDALAPTIVDEMIAQGFAFESIQGELQNIFFAAFDTSTALLSNLMDSVARDDRVQSRLRRELMTVIGPGRIPSESDLGRLLYLRATILETLRLHSPVTSHIRQARVDTTLPSGPEGQPVVMLRGMSVIWSTYALNRTPETCRGADWDIFRPERWLEGDEEGEGLLRLVVSDCFMPFGSGPRNCLGQQFALCLVSYIMARVLMTFKDFELERPELAFQEAAAVTFYNGHGTRVRYQ